MNPQERAKLKHAVGEVLREAEDVDMEHIEFIIGLASRDEEAWYAVRKHCPALQLPTIEHSSNAAVTQLRASLWPAKIQQSLLSAGVSDNPRVHGFSRSDSIDSLYSGESDVAQTSNANPANLQTDSTPEAVKAAALPDRTLEVDAHDLATPPPSSAQSADAARSEKSPQDIASSPLELAGVQAFRRKYGSGAGLKRKLAQSEDRMSGDKGAISQKEEPVKRRRGQQKLGGERQDKHHGDTAEFDLAFEVRSLEVNETLMREACKKALALFSPFEKVTGKRWLQKRPKTAKPEEMEINDRLEFLEDRFEAFDHFIRRHVMADDTTPIVEFDRSASNVARVQALDDKHEWMDRTLRKQTREAELTWAKK